MTEIFLKIVNMSISASYIVLAVLILRLLLKKAPKWIAVVLWGIVAVRLVCPFSIESALSLIPSSEVVSPAIMTDSTPKINTGISAINQAVNPVIGGSFTPDSTTSANPLRLWIPTFAIIWIIGMVALIVYTVISYAKVRRKIGTAVLLRDNIYQSENVNSPFVLGIIKPRIYLPFNMNGKDAEHVVAHETAHIRRKDHLWKPLGFLLLTLHWFNPLMWLGYVLLCRDIELACDEKVIKELDRDARADYSEALLNCSVNRRTIAACPLAFGEVGVKGRVKSVLSYKKPAFWIIVAAVVACVAVAVCFLTNPKDNSYDETDSNDSSFAWDFPLENDYIYIQDLGCDVEDVKIAFEKARFEDGELVFDIRWTNESAETIDIGPDFEVYKYNGSTFEKLENKGAWNYYRDLLAGKGTDSDVVLTGTIPYETTASYNLSAHYDVLAPGKYRFEAHGAWIEFKIIDNFDVISGVYDTATFDVDGDGKEENCSLRYGHTSGLFSFIFSVRDKETGETKYETDYILAQAFEPSFQKGADGKMKVRGIRQGENPETHLFDISIEDGNVILTENGVRVYDALGLAHTRQ